jgi:autotransporter-associated beta strand protein
MTSSRHSFSRWAIGCGRAFCLLAAGWSAANVHAAIVTWDGGGVNNNWTSALNWVGDNAPVANDSLVFDGFTRLTPNNDFLAGTAFDGLRFAVTAGAFALGGNQITLHGDIVDNTAVLTQTVNNPVALDARRNVDVIDNGLLTVGGIISGSGFGFTKTGNGTLTLTGVNTFTGPAAVNAGVVSVASDSNLGAAPVAPTSGQLVLNGGTIRATATFALTSNRGIAVGPPTGSGAGTIDVTSGGILSYGGIIANNGSSTGGLIKTSFGGLTLSGANTYTGPTIVKVGTLTLDFAQATSPSSNVISPSSALTLGGANAGLGGTSFAALTITGGGGSNSQTFNGTTIDIGPAIVRVNSGGGPATLNLGTLAHNPGGVVNFVRPASGNITTTTPNTGGILGGWATVGTGTLVGTITVGNEWAAVDGSGNIIPYAGHLNYLTGTKFSALPGYSATANLRINGTSNGDPLVDTAGAGSTTDINTIQFSEAAGA